MIGLTKLPKIELHLHFDGSVAPELLENEGYSKDEFMSLHDQTLNDYLKKFDVANRYLQTREHFILAAQKLIQMLEDDGVLYAEIRFAPMKHLQYLSKEEVVDAILEGLQSKTVQTNLILCMMRGSSVEENKKVIDLAEAYLDRGVCAIDLAGAEALYPTEDYRELFELARRKNIPYTIHAGEAAGKDSLESAISFLPTRLGHGVRALEDNFIISSLQSQKIVLEICPTSNIQTGVFENMRNHGIQKLYDLGIHVTINTDNRTVSNVTLEEEYQILEKTFGFQKADFIQMNLWAIDAAFLSDECKEILRKRYLEHLTKS